MNIHDLLCELQTWIEIPKGTLDLARYASNKLSERDFKEFCQLTRDWENGKYDEDVQTLYDRLITIVNRYNNY